MNEGISTPSHGEGAGGGAGGLPPQAVPAVKKFFLVEYMEEVRRGFSWMRAAPKPDQSIITKVTVGLKKWSKLRKARIGMAVVVVIIVAASGVFAGQAANVQTVPDNGVVPPGETGHKETWNFSGTVNENGNTSVKQKADTPRFTALVMNLTWTDEPATSLRTNQPDELGFFVTAPNGATWPPVTGSNQVGGPGRVSWTLDDTAKDYGAGEWTITVEGGAMGDITKTSGNPVCFVGCGPDSSNRWSLTIQAAW